MVVRRGGINIYLFHLFINYNTITNHVLITYELSRPESLVGIEPTTLTLIA